MSAIDSNKLRAKMPAEICVKRMRKNYAKICEKVQKAGAGETGAKKRNAEFKSCSDAQALRSSLCAKSKELHRVYRRTQSHRRKRESVVLRGSTGVTMLLLDHF